MTKRKFRRYLYVQYARLMILRCGVWFVDIPRTSSSSIRAELGGLFGRSYGKRNLLEKEHVSPQIFKDHKPAREMRKILGDYIWNKIFTFSVVRNPWDRIYSMYNYRIVEGSLPKELSFRDYVLALGKGLNNSNLFKYHGHRYGASDYVTDDDDNIIVDFIAKYENREEDLKKVASHLKIKNFGELWIQKASPKHRLAHYSGSYDEETKEIIKRCYSKDIELFDYEFENQV